MSDDRVTNWQLAIKDLKDDQPTIDAKTAKAVFELIKQRQQMEDSCEGESHE